MTDISTKKRYIANINKLTPAKFNKKPHLAKCGDYGDIYLDHSANADLYSKRIFVVSKSKKLANGGCWTFNKLRQKILAD